jgi:nicotinamidase/pyrazinamidase
MQALSFLYIHPVLKKVILCLFFIIAVRGHVARKKEVTRAERCININYMNRLLIVVDYQNDFVQGSLGFPEARSYYDRILSSIDAFSASGDEVVFTRDLHDENYLHTEEGRNLPVLHCQRGTDGAKFYGDLENRSRNCKVFEKDTFPSLALGEYLSKRNYDTIVLCGLDLSICVLANAVMAKSACPDAHIIVDVSASGTGDSEAQVVALKELKRLQIECRDLSKEHKGYS